MEIKVKNFVNGQDWSNDFDINGMLEFASKITHTDNLETLQKLSYSLVAVNYHTVARSLNLAIDKLKVGNTDIKAEIELFLATVKNEIETKVVFYYNKKNNDLFAFFPDTTNGTVFGQSYSHIGQHSECHILYVQESRKATKKEYKDLKLELEKQGYVLAVLN